MADSSITYAQSRAITAFFDTREAAEKATEDLAKLGVSRQQIRMTEGNAGSTVGDAAKSSADKGFWEELKDMFLPDEDRQGYAEGLRRGGYLLSVQVNDGVYDQALSVLDTDGAVNMDEREASWRASGWTGYQAESATQSTEKVGIATAASSASAALSRSASTKPTQLEAGQDEVIPVYEETARIGKRDVNHGRVRLRSYVVETPITEQVNLRNEEVRVERRPVDRVVAASDAVFQDRVIEAEERVEEAVIGKETRVKEEISLRKTVETQAKTISDTVRRTEVEIEDERSGHALKSVQGFTASTDAGRIADHMDVIASDGVKIGTVDHLDGERIKLARTTSPDGQHHYIPLAWIDHVDTHVHLSRPAAEAKASW